jgi:hypothetical protein
MVMRRSLCIVQAVLCRHCDADLLDGGDRAPARSVTWAQDGSGHRAPDGEQQGQQNKDDNAQILHVG